VRVLACIIVALIATGSARADTAAARVKTGEDLAKRGRLTEAIESFKAADKLEKRAKHACLIALAYIRRELWPQAEIFLTVCHERATKSDPVPDWVALAEKQLAERLATAKVASVNIRVQPTELATTASIVVSSFEPDEAFAPRTIHLPRGKHLITATIEGKDPVSQTLEVTDEAPREVVLDFAPRMAPAEPVPIRKDDVAARPGPPPPKGRSKLVPYGLVIGGGAVLAAGVVFHATAYKSTRDDLDAASSAGNVMAYDELSSKFDSRRTITIALYAIGAVTLASGLVLDRTVYKDRRPQMSLVPISGGAMAVVGWSR
jgi:hypothetical protein